MTRKALIPRFPFRAAVCGGAVAVIAAFLAGPAEGRAVHADGGHPPFAASDIYPPVRRAGVQGIVVHCSLPGPRRVSFGMPFPRGFLTDAGRVRVETAGGAEVPADVVELARWRHFADTSIDGQSIRSVLISFVHSCAAGQTASYQVRWGSTRTRRAALGLTPATATANWVPKAAPAADEGPETDNYQVDAAAEPIAEPASWVTLPVSWLAQQIVRGPLAPAQAPALAEYRLGYGRTYVNDVAADVRGFEANDDGHGLIDWSTEVEGWLYDRPLGLWNLYFATGDGRWLRHAHRASQFYAAWVASDDTHAPHQRGAFRKRRPDGPGDGGDPKYSLAGGLLADYLMTGDGRLLDKIRAIGEFLARHVATRLLPAGQTTGLWTERQVGVALAGAMYAYEATGDAVFRQRAREIVAGMAADVAAPPPGYPAVHGVLLHRPEVHEGDTYPDWIMSPWMSALLCESLWHYYLMSDDVVALRLLSNYAQFVAERSIYPDPRSGRRDERWYPQYLTGLAAGHPQAGPSEDREHAFDVMGLLLRGRWARRRLGLQTELIDEQIERLRLTALDTFGYWKREQAALPRFRLTPTRKFGWWFGTTADVEWYTAQQR